MPRGERSFRVVGVAAAVGLLLCSRAAVAGVLHGVLAGVDARSLQIVVKDKDGDHNRLGVSPSAYVTLNGKRAKLSSLRAGDTVVVSFREDERGRATATAIIATRAKKPSR